MFAGKRWAPACLQNEGSEVIWKVTLKHQTISQAMAIKSEATTWVPKLVPNHRLINTAIAPLSFYDSKQYWAFAIMSLLHVSSLFSLPRMQQAPAINIPLKHIEK